MKKIEQKFSEFFEKNTIKIIKYRWLVILLVLVVTAFSINGLFRLRANDSFDAWLLENDPLLVNKEKYKAIFGNNEYVIALLEADDVFAPKIVEKVRVLSDYMEKEVALADRVTSITHLDFVTASEDGIVTDELIPETIPKDIKELHLLRDKAAKKSFLVDRLFKADGKSTAVVLRLLPYPEDNTESYYRIKTADKVYEIIGRPEFKDLKITLAGMPVTNRDKTRYYSQEGARMFKYAFIVMGIMLIVMLRSLSGVISVFITGLLSLLWSFGLQGYFDMEVQSMMVILPVLLLMVISVGYSIHIFSFFQQKFEETGDRDFSIKYSIGQSCWPVFSTVVTTALGFLSFQLVDVSAIRWVGLTSAQLAVTTYPLIIFLTPVILSFKKEHESVKKTKEKHIEKNTNYVKKQIFLEKFGDWVLDNGKVLVGLFVFVTFVFFMWSFDLTVNTDVLKSEGIKVPYVKNSMKVANNIGSFYSYEFVVSFAKEGMAKDPENLKKMDILASELEKADIVKRTRSVTEIIKDLNQTLNEGRKEFYTVPDSREMVGQLFLLYEMSGGSGQEDWIDYEAKNLRLSVEMMHFDAKIINDQFKYLNKRAKELFPGAKVFMTGSVVTFAKMVNYLVNGQIKSTLFALLAVGGVMMLFFGSIRIGLVGMIPNIVPLIFIIGTMGLLGIPLHFMTIMISPMIIGIAVDDTIHYITHFKKIYEEYGCIKTANRKTFRSVGKAIFYTSFIIIMGFLPFITSDALGYNHITILMFISVSIALLSDYIITPNLLKWFFERKNRKKVIQILDKEEGII